MNIAFIENCAAILLRSPLVELEYEADGACIRLRRDALSGGAVDRVAAAGDCAAETARTTVASPATGVFLARHPLMEQAMAEPGAVVSAGQAVGFLQAGDILSAVRAPADGVVGEPMVPDGTLVGYGQALFLLAPLLHA